MKQARTYKIILFFAAVVMFISAGFSLLTSKTAFAETSNYFGGNNEGIKLDGTNAVVTVKDDSSFIIKKSLVLNQLLISAKPSEKVTKIEVTFSTPSYDVNGEEVNHKLVIPTDGSAISFNEQTGTDVYAKGTDLNIKFAVVGNDLKVSLGGEFVGSTSPDYKVENNGACVASLINFAFEVEGEESTQFTLKAIDQNYENTNGDYKQTFNTVEGKENGEISKIALPRIVAENDSIYVNTDEGTKAIAIMQQQYTFNFKAYSLVQDIKDGDLYLDKAQEDDEIWIINGEKPCSLLFKNLEDNSFVVRDSEKVYETITFDVVDKNADDFTNEAPKYNMSTEAIESFKAKLAKAIIVEEGEGSDKISYNVRLGEKVKVPSMAGLITDDFTSYSELTYTLYYKTPKTSGSTGSLEITTDSAGKYEFFVVFKDTMGGAMEKDDFYTIDEDDSNAVTKGEYYDYVFSFVISDNAPIKVDAVVQSKGYVNTPYTVSAFSISAAGFTPTYELYYNSDVNAIISGSGWEANWTKIPNASSVTEESELPQGFTYEEITNIGYTGALKFTPTKAGKYVVKCTVTSSLSVRTGSDVAVIIVEEEPQKVKPASDWLQQNVWSVVFLSVGTVCLIAIIVLLFVKPKENVEDND